MSSAPTPSTTGVHHVGLTVRDPSRCAAFFKECLGFKIVAERPDYPAVFVRDSVVMLTLWALRGPTNCANFDRHHQLGLHHLALNLAPGLGLEAMHRRLRAREDVEIEFAPEALGGGPLRHLMAIVQDSFRLELVTQEPNP